MPWPAPEVVRLSVERLNQEHRQHLTGYRPRGLDQGSGQRTHSTVTCSGETDGATFSVPGDRPLPEGSGHGRSGTGARLSTAHGVTGNSMTVPVLPVGKHGSARHQALATKLDSGRPD